MACRKMSVCHTALHLAYQTASPQHLSQIGSLVRKSPSTLVALSGPFNQNHLALGRFETQGFGAMVFLGVVPALGLFEAREF